MHAFAGVTMFVAVAPAQAWVECGEVQCVGPCEYNCFCVIHDDDTGEYRGFVLFKCD